MPRVREQTDDLTDWTARREDDLPSMSHCTVPWSRARRCKGKDTGHSPLRPIIPQFTNPWMSSTTS